MPIETLYDLKRPVTELPKDNPSKRVGQNIPAEGEDGLFSQSWFPICLSTEVGKGEIRGEPFLDGKVLVYRGDDGIARVMSSYCPHLGADLSAGKVVGDSVQCPFHKWEFDTNGGCIKTAIGDPAPENAKIFKFPTQERFGIIWAFNGNEPLWDIPGFEIEDERLAIRVYRFDSYINCDPWVFASNTPDIQHFKILHGIKFAEDDLHDRVRWGDFGFRYRFAAEHQNGIPIDWTFGIRGNSFFWQEGTYDDFWFGGAVGFGLPTPGKHLPFGVTAVEKGDGSPEAMELIEKKFETTDMLIQRTVGEDMDILNSIHYRPGALTAGDRSLGKFMQYLRRYPRAHPSADFIK